MVCTPSMCGPLMVPPQVLGGLVPAASFVAARLYDSDGNALFDSDGNALWVMVPE